MVAVVIPFYKISFFNDTLESLKIQTNKNFNVYIGDDCSPENPKSLIKKYENDLNITYKRFSSNIGGNSLVEHWERCIEMSHDEKWIMILGDDDFLEENLIEQFYIKQNIFHENANLIRFSSQLISPLGEHLSGIFQHPTWESASNAFFRKMNKTSRSSLSEYIFSRDKYLKYKFHPYLLGWYSDDRAWLEFSDWKPIFTINEASVYIRISNLSISGDPGNWDQKVQSRKDFFLYLVSEKISEFSPAQRLIVLKFFEKILIEENISTFHIWAHLSYLFGIHTSPKEILKFFRRILIRKIAGLNF